MNHRRDQRCSSRFPHKKIFTSATKQHMELLLFDNANWLHRQGVPTETLLIHFKKEWGEKKNPHLDSIVFFSVTDWKRTRIRKQVFNSCEEKCLSHLFFGGNCSHFAQPLDGECFFSLSLEKKGFRGKVWGSMLK